MTEEKEGIDHNIEFLKHEIKNINKQIKDSQHNIKHFLIIKHALEIGLKQLQKNKK